MPHGQHSQSANLLRRVEDDRREARRHFRIESNLDARLNFILAFHQQVQQFLRVDHRLPVVRHQADQRRVPLVDNLREGRRAGGHQDLAHAIVVLGHGIVVDAEEALRGALLGHVVLQVPHAVLVGELLRRGAALRQDSALESAELKRRLGLSLL